MRKCKCGCEPVMYAEGLGRRAIYPKGTIDDFYFKEYYGYAVRCNECCEETDVYTTIEKATEAWNDGKIYDENGNVILNIKYYGDPPYPVVTQEFVNKLAQYEDLEESGMLQIYPCAINDMVYCIYKGEIKQGIVTSISKAIYKKGKDFIRIEVKFEILDPEDGKYKRRGIHGVYQESVFLTKMEAEEKLKEVLNNGTYL